MNFISYPILREMLKVNKFFILDTYSLTNLIDQLLDLYDLLFTKEFI
jgi:hypothetical protein